MSLKELEFRYNDRNKDQIILSIILLFYCKSNFYHCRMELARKVLFYVFILVYVIVCPYIVFYSFGYIYQPAKKNIFHTGLVYLSTIPPGADIYLEKSRFKHKTPATITELKPGQYQISLRLKEYRPWSHHVMIESGKALTLDAILLLPWQLNKVNIAPGDRYVNMSAIRGTDRLVVQKGKKIRESYLYDLKKETFTALADDDSAYIDFAIDTIFTGKESELLILYGGSLWDKEYLFIESNNESLHPREITDLFLSHPESILLSAEFPNDIFVVYEDYINRLDIQKMSVYPKYFDNVKGFGLSDKRIYVLDNDNVLTKTTLDKEQKNILLEDEHLGKDLFGRSDFYDIDELDKGILIFRGTRGDLILTIPPYRIIGEGALGMEYDKSHSRLLFWTKDEIWLSEFDAREEDDFLFKDRASLRRIYEDGANISHCFWVYAGAHILFKDKSDVYLLELLPDGTHHIEHIVTVKEDDDLYYDETDGSLYYLNRKGTLMRVQILPKERMLFETVKEEEGKV